MPSAWRGVVVLGVAVRVGQGSPEKQNQSCVCKCAPRLILRNWRTPLWRLANPQSGGQAGRPETQGRADVAAQAQRQAEEVPLPRGPQTVFSSDLQLIDCTRPTPMMEGSLLYSKSTDLNVHLI